MNPPTATACPSASAIDRWGPPQAYLEFVRVHLSQGRDAEEVRDARDSEVGKASAHKSNPFDRTLTDRTVFVLSRMI